MGYYDEVIKLQEEGIKILTSIAKDLQEWTPKTDTPVKHVANRKGNCKNCKLSIKL